MDSKNAAAVPLTGNNVVEIIPNRLYWVTDRVPPRSQGKSSYFNIDNELKYEPFNADFGPLNLSKVYRFVTELDTLLKQPDFKSHIIYHYCSLDSAKKANAAFLMGCFQVLILERNAEEAWKRFEKITPPFVPFRDASMGGCTYQCTILDCLRGLEYAIKLKWFDLKTFDCRKYEYYEKIENGDLNWIIPNKFVAFSTPNSSPKDAYGFRTFTPDDYSPVFKSLGVTTVVRLSKPQYDREKFIKNGFKHHDLYFLDGSTPSDVRPFVPLK